MDMRMVDELLRPSVQHRHHVKATAEAIIELARDRRSIGEGKFSRSERVDGKPMRVYVVTAMVRADDSQRAAL
jgi:hypothetical protein